jgi:hypothetical protein
MSIPISRSGRQMSAVAGTNLKAARPWEFRAAEARSFVQRLLEAEGVRPYLAKTRHRVISLEPAVELDKSRAPSPPTRWTAVVYDYTNNRALRVSADYPESARIQVVESRQQPLPSYEEWGEAVEILEADPDFGPLLAQGQIIPYRAMPPLSEMAGSSGEIERALHVGLRPAAGSELPNQIVAVNLIRGAVESYRSNHPPGSLATEDLCGAPDAFGCPIPLRGTPGELWIAWPQDNPVWRFLAVRPASSSGTRGSGIELRYVDYRGRRVLYQAHVPILNVLYERDACGPFRDWQFAEHCIQAQGVDVAPGFRWCTTPPKTICESGDDRGNFNGVAIYESGDELVLVTEMEAGWYRYIQEWRLHRDGTIRPRFKFSATSSSCVCQTHTHHCYWRFDFDLSTPEDNVVEEYNENPLSGAPSWTTLRYEIKRNREAGRNRKWRVRSSKTLDQYEIIPGAWDGVADAYGRGDFWAVRYRGASETDDGYNQTSGPGTAANIDGFVQGEVVENQDLVLWYGAHFAHREHEESGMDCHALGPTLRPVTCPVSAAARGTPLADDLSDLRALRDQVLARSPAGARYIALLEEHAAELVARLAADGRLRKQAAKVLERVAKVVRTRDQARPTLIEPRLTREAERLLDELAAKCSPALNEVIQSVRVDLAHFEGRTIAEGLNRASR